MNTGHATSGLPKDGGASGIIRPVSSPGSPRKGLILVKYSDPLTFWKAMRALW